MCRKIFTLLGSLLLLASTSAFAQSGNWLVSEAAGTVLARTATAVIPARKGVQVPPGTVVSTGQGSRAVLVRGKDFMTVNANGRVRIPSAEEQGPGLFDVLQEWGNAVFQIEKKPNPHFGVRTRYLAAVVKGTTFSITVTEQGASLQVVEGAVETSTADGGARELITPGVVAMVEAADRMRLTVQGQQTKTIDSPERANTPVRDNTAKDTASPSPEATAPASDPRPEAAILPETSRAPMVSSSPVEFGEREHQELTEAITAKPTNLGAATDGFVSGTVVAQVASADVSALRMEHGGNGRGGADNGIAGGNSRGGSDNGIASGNDKGSDNTRPEVGASASDSDKSGSNGSGSDNGNAGGNGSGSNNGNSGNNGSSSDNGNSGSNGNGNGNGSGSGSDNRNASAIGGGSENGNAGGNGNGNGSNNSNGGGNEAGPNNGNGGIGASLRGTAGGAGLGVDLGLNNGNGSDNARSRGNPGRNF